MIAILKHELRLYFHSLTAYVFGAFLLVMIGVGAMLYNINAAYSNFEYVLSFSSLIFAVIVPILTMRVIAEERKQKTDQLLYSLPISTTKIILGKYAALLVLYLIPLAVVCMYPLIFSKYGEVYLLTSYGSLLAYFIMGGALIAIGVFISSLTENQGFAAGIGIAVMLFNYFSVSLAEYATATAIGSAIVLFALSGLLGWIIYHLTKNSNLGSIVGLGLMTVVVGSYWLIPDKLEGLIPKVMKALSLFAQFETFVSGVFDLTAIVYFISVIIFFLFLSVQSLEKRRYN